MCKAPMAALAVDPWLVSKLRKQQQQREQQTHGGIRLMGISSGVWAGYGIWEACLMAGAFRVFSYAVYSAVLGRPLLDLWFVEGIDLL